MQESTMNWDDLRVFLAVARTGRVSAAARQLHVEHTTVSRRLTALEHAVGVPLFYRTAAGYVLTTHGRNVLSNADAMEQAALSVGARAREATTTVAGRVRVSLPPEFASHWLVPKLPALRAKYPQLIPQILVATRQRDLVRGEAELALQGVRPTQPGVVAVRIGRTTLALYASTALVAGGRLRVTTPASLRGHALLVYTRAFMLLQEAAWFQRLLAAAPVALETNSTHALVAAARAGSGVAVLPTFVARAYDDLVAVSADVAGHDIWLTTHPDFRRDPTVRATADFIKRIAADPKAFA
jgi:DNA-binding transcriptional LysR family regulator